MRSNTFVVGASRSLVATSERDARTPRTPYNLCGEVLVMEAYIYPKDMLSSLNRSVLI